MATPAIGHANSIPFMLVGLIVAQDPVFSPDDVNTAQGYVALYLIMHSVTLWGVGMNVISKEKDEDLSTEAPPGESMESTESTAQPVEVSSHWADGSGSMEPWGW